MVDDRKQGGEELHHSAHKPKSALAAREEETLAFWEESKIFEKSLAKDAPKGEYVFYDGPPFANGLPHYGHILASTIKDAIPRYRTMQGYRVQRRWGWDCHGLPVENLVEKELGFKTKRDIEQYGIEKFNKAARTSIMKDVADWRRIIPRLGRWADMEHDYKTMDATYTESVWWAFKNLYDKGLVYEGFKGMHFCPRCGTTLSNNEVALGYKDIDDVAVTVKLPLVDEPDTSLLIWTTTAWTLPGNTAAAVNPDFTYQKVKVGEEYFIAAEGKVEGEVVATMQGRELVGKQYLPPFDYFATELHKHKTHAWRVYAAPYVTKEDGTGIVHLAPAFGAEDLELAQRGKIPLIHHVTEEGKFIATVRDFAGLFVKPKGNPRETDEKVAALLKERGLLVKEEKVKHSYPHCWRCDTPLLNWAANSWFVKVSALKQKLLAENAEIGWTPEHVGQARFRNGLESAPDWAISRSRYWGAPLPVWRNQKTKAIKVAGSVGDLLAMVKKSGNRYTVMRHGQAENNVRRIMSSSVEGHPLTAQGREEARAAAQKLPYKPTRVYASPLMRTKETARIVAEALGIDASTIVYDERLRELSFGEFEEKPLDDFLVWRSEHAYGEQPESAESYLAAKRRFGDFLFELEKKHAGENILIVTHGIGLESLSVASQGLSSEISKEFIDNQHFHTAHIVELPFVPYPHNKDYELDLHRPYIDNVDTGEWKRVPDVFDCWFESGSMPYASNHYPFKKAQFDPKGFFGFGAKGYPADFIAEGVDQTRGWFYSLIVLGTALFGKSPYKNVIVNGLILASDGQKMSKRLRNYPDPMDVVEKYGADALRYYLLSSQLLRGEDLRFQEKGVDEITKKLLMRLDNVRSFYDLFVLQEPAQKKVLGSPVSAKPHEAGRPDHFSAQVPAHALDRWILARLAELVRDTTAGFEKYELDVACRPLMTFADDLSTWYVRRSRDRFKEVSAEALATLRHVLLTLAKVMAPVMPFFADDLYRRMGGEEESVHLALWPEIGAADEELLKNMAATRALASKGLELRERAGIKVRQPLARLTVKYALPEELQQILADEINVKEVVVDPALQEDVVLDTELTPELREEGTLRDWVRAIQEWRKEQKLSVSDRPGLLVHTPDAEFIRRHREVLMQATGLMSLETKEGELEFKRL